MVKRDITQLAVYELNEETEQLPLACLCTLYLEKTSEVIYITKNKKLYGIICQQEVLSAKKHGTKIKINSTFTKLPSFNIVKAHRIFARKSNIHKIPVINESGELIGDFSQWDDLLYIERNAKQLMYMANECVEILEQYNNVYVVKPIANKLSIYLQLINWLDDFGIVYTILEKDQIGSRLIENANFIFADEDERRGVACLYGIEPYLRDTRGNDTYKYDIWKTKNGTVKLSTIKSLIIQVIELNQLHRLKIKKPENLHYNEIDDKATVLLSDLNKKGVKCFELYAFDADDLSDYCKNFKAEVAARLQKYPLSLKEPWPRENDNRNFYDDLYKNEDYVKEIAQREMDQIPALNYKNNVTGKYCKARDGRRITCFQPEKFIGTIYLCGQCAVLGRFVEDQYTIASILQKKLLESGYAYRVENYGDMMRVPYPIDEKLEEMGQLFTNDIIIYMATADKRIVDIQGGKSVEKIYEEHHTPSTWVTDSYWHCNHKVTQVFADDIFKMIEPCLAKEKSVNERISLIIREKMTEYIQNKYLKQTFIDFDAEKYRTIGAIIMEYDPFDNRHRYMIEQAKQKVEFLILFVMEEDKGIGHSCLFSFEERFKSVSEGVKDLENIMVVSGGSFVCSGIAFPCYLVRTRKNVAIYSKYDIDVFVNHIARPLHITHCFIEKEPDSENVKIHNAVMKDILSQSGISCVEIPEPDGVKVSTSVIQKYLRNEEYDKAFEMLPESTRRILMFDGIHESSIVREEG